MVPVIIVLLIIGSILILASFLFRDSMSGDAKRRVMTEDEIEQLVEKRFSEVKYRLDDEAEKSADMIRNQTERELEKLSNEKIMAVNEYSDQVMDQINKNHNEVMFLYSMLSDKQKELDHAVENIHQIHQKTENEKKLAEHAVRKVEEEKPDAAGEKKKSAQKTEENVQLSFDRFLQEEPVQTSGSGKYSNKEKIMQMYQDGASSLEIARELHLGVGEVRLVIGLSKERQE